MRISILFLLAAWQDSSPHQVKSIAVEDGVALEVLDWGGSGRPVVLLAGYNTAHIYDHFAEKLRANAHVYGITRRGYGASTRPATGYDAERTAEDVRAVLDALKIEAPVLAGNSFGAQDMTYLAEKYPQRIAGLVYLNSAEDPTLRMGDYGIEPPDPKRLPLAMRAPQSPDKSSFAAYRTWQMRTTGVSFPEAELRQLFEANADGSIGKFLGSASVRDAMFRGIRKPQYALIEAPVLATFNPPLLEQRMTKYSPQNEEEASALRQAWAFDNAVAARQKHDLVKGIPKARVVDLPGSSLYVFLSNEADVLREIRAFLTTLQ